MYHRYPNSCDIPVFCSQWWTDFSSWKEVPLLHQKEHNLLVLLDAFFKGWDAQLWHQTASGLLYHEESRLHINRSTTFRIIWKSDSDSQSVDFHRQFFSGFRNVFPYLKNHSLDECHGFRFRHITSQGIQMF